MMQRRICAHLRHPRQAFRASVGLDYSHPHTVSHGPTQMDETSIDLCDWLNATHATMPGRLRRVAGGGLALNDYECDTCPCFAPVSIAIPGSRDQQDRPSNKA
jgi:hypothetical protein